MVRPFSILLGSATLSLGLFPSSAGRDVTAVLINGGYKSSRNYESHLVHLEGVHAGLQSRGISDDQIVAFISDGGDDGRDMASQEAKPLLWWLLDGTQAEGLLPRTRLVDTPWDGEQQPASRASLGLWLRTTPFAPNSTVLLYVTDHGYRNARTDPPEAGLWMWGEKLSPDDLHADLQAMAPDVRTVLVMSQCYSGAFAELAWRDGVPDGDLCGFFSVPADRQAFGCYPDGRSRALGHGYRFADSLPGAADLRESHQWIQLADRTPDVPLTTSDLYLQHLLEQNHESLDAALLQWLPGVSDWSRVDALSTAFGLPIIRDLSALQDAEALLAERSAHQQDTANHWERLRRRVVGGHMSVLQQQWPELTTRLDDVRGLEAKEALRGEIEVRLREGAEVRGDWLVLQSIRDHEQEVEALVWREVVRTAALARIRGEMVRLAGEAMLAERRRLDPDVRGLQRLQACEATAIGQSSGALPELPPPYPPTAEDAARLDALRPSFLGIRFAPVSPERAGELGVMGAVEVESVSPDSPAAQAGVAAHDILLGIDAQRFQTPNAIQALIAMADRSQPMQLQGLRGDQPMAFTVQLVPRP